MIEVGENHSPKNNPDTKNDPKNENIANCETLNFCECMEKASAKNEHCNFRRVGAPAPLLLGTL